MSIYVEIVIRAPMDALWAGDRDECANAIEALSSRRSETCAGRIFAAIVRFRRVSVAL